MYNVKQIIEPAPRDYSPSNWIEFCNRLPSNQAIAWQFGAHYLDAYDAQLIALDAYIHQALTGKLNLDNLKRDYKGLVATSYKLVTPRTYEVNLPRILNQLPARLGFTFSGQNPIDIENDDYIKRNFAPSTIPFHLPLLVNDSGTEPSLEDWFFNNRLLVEL